MMSPLHSVNCFITALKIVRSVMDSTHFTCRQRDMVGLFPAYRSFIIMSVDNGCK
jgi:hypothetical protein